MTLVARTKQILLAPDDAWRELEREQPSFLRLLFAHAAPLAAIGPVAVALRAQLLEVPPPQFSGLEFVAAGTALNLAAAAFIGVAALFVAAVCGGKRDFYSALALSFYSATPVWLSAIAAILPDRAVYAIVVFGALMYSLYLFYLGLSGLLKVPQDDAGIATAIVVTLGLATFAVLGWGLALVI